MLPKSEEERKNQSPLYKVEKIQSPLFIMHGDKDIRCDISQSERLVSKLKEHKKDVRFDIFKDTGHWITNEGERKQAYSNLIQFFDKHLKK